MFFSINVHVCLAKARLHVVFLFIKFIVVIVASFFHSLKTIKFNKSYVFLRLPFDVFVIILVVFAQVNYTIFTALFSSICHSASSASSSSHTEINYKYRPAEKEFRCINFSIYIRLIKKNRLFFLNSH